LLGADQSFQNEARIEKLLSSKNLHHARRTVIVIPTGITDSFNPSRIQAIVQNKIKGINLKEALLPSNQSRSLFCLNGDYPKQMVSQAKNFEQGLDFLVKNGITHQYLKSYHIKFEQQPDGSFLLRLIDFGSGMHKNGNDNSFGGTFPFMPPELPLNFLQRC
jgi:serine/threonine protein kinase